MQHKLKFLNLFAGAGGLSEGFIRAGFSPVAHIETDPSACFTLRTRMAWHWLKSQGREDIYKKYISGKLSRRELYDMVPERCINSVINEEIDRRSLPGIFEKIDALPGNRKIDLIIGGPPCQAYSIVGRSRDKNGMRGDKRNHLYRYYAECLKRYKPACFVFENVVGLKSAKNKNGGLYLDNMREMFRQSGYKTEVGMLSAKRHGVLQNRRRVVLFGRAGNHNGTFPEPEEWNPGVEVWEALSGLPPLRAGEGCREPCKTGKTNGSWLKDAKVRDRSIPVTCHQARPNTEQDLEIYRRVVQLWNTSKKRLTYNSLPERLKTHKHRNSFIDRFKVVAADLPYSHTIVAHIAKDGHYYIHPDIRQNRSITPREAARIQTFPDDYYFESASARGWRTAAFRQIGNAVPVLLAEKLALKLLESWR